jgi:uncharacterized protein (DUF433 family)
MRSRDDLLSRISSDPKVCFGKPVIRGTRIWVSLVLDMMASGKTEGEILLEYPHLSVEDIQACLAYGSLTAHERCIPLPIAR